MLVTMKEILDRASKENYAVAAPNVGNELNARASIEAAEDMNAPLILDVAFHATSDIFFFGHELRLLAEQSSVPIAVNLDHGTTLEQVQKAINAGFTSVMIDRSSYPDTENIRDVKEVVKIAHAAGISVEAELGHVGHAENYAHDRDAALTDPELAKKYIEETGVDCLAVAIGTAHRAYPAEFKPYLDFDRLIEIKKATNHFPLVLHGSSGTDSESLRKACQLGINKVNINNDLCKATVESIRNKNFDGNKAYAIFRVVQEGFKEKLKEMIAVYGSADKAWLPKVSGLPRSKMPNNLE
ncbi:Fructose-bisphosphate aldolase [bioreactor metagenome]|uniref:Fructose-bisphosphate aldolase n=1 Tax=bioreactor metagenome TaxID=1076179 RepID=A0A644ZBT5_9ZZZZ